jgi:hypothetical protein
MKASPGVTKAVICKFPEGGLDCATPGHNTPAMCGGIGVMTH